MKIKIENAHYVLVDKDDFEHLNRFKWRATTCKRKNQNGEVVFYTQVVRTINNRTVAMEYFILPLDTQRCVFANGNRFDFRKKNLIPVNARMLVHRGRKYHIKKPAKFSSIYKGVCHRDNRWQARIGYNGERLYLGSFLTEQEAGEAYNKKARELYGKLAYQNKIKK